MSAMKILLLGSNGQVGWELQRSLAPLGEVVALQRDAAANPPGLSGNLEDMQALARTVRAVAPTVIVNAAAYTASKAASDHLVRAWHHTYGLPVLTTNCSNNYGPFHFPEKLIPLMIVNALAGKPLPVYGDGMQVRDWLYVKDHCSAIRRVLEAGRLGETYNVGGWNEKPNIEIVHTVCALLDELRPSAEVSYKRLITHVKDRPGHDRRYAIDARKIERELGWRPAETFETGIRKTVQWYLSHPEWVQRVQSGAYRDWVQQQYA